MQQRRANAILTRSDNVLH